jgi:hypothetical protein
MIKPSQAAMLSTRALVALAATPLTAAVVSAQIVPAEPIAREDVALRVPFELYEDGPCMGRALVEHTEVWMSGSRIAVRVFRDPDFVSIVLPPPDQCADLLLQVPLGRFPQGDYVLELFIDDAETPALIEHFAVSNPFQGERDHPSQDYAGVWWSPRHSGGALLLEQSARGQLGGFWMTHDEAGQPVWYWVALGRWTGPGTYEGPLLRTKGGAPPSFPALEPAPPGTTEVIGEARLRFGSGSNDMHLSFAYRFAGGDWQTRSLRRFAF